jgi:hypothetical protein
MRIALAAVCLTICCGLAAAQERPGARPMPDHNAAATMSPEAKGQTQPQGDTGPTNTTAGGAPAESPQGETPPGMQSAPEGSSRSVDNHKP